MWGIRYSEVPHLSMASSEHHSAVDFIRAKIFTDQETQRFGQRVHTRFPPEPNGHLHIGHAKSICLNFGIAQEFGGRCNLRFDDTNPIKEHMDYVQSIQEDIRWLGFDWGDRLFYASDYFEKLYEFSVKLIRKGKAYVDSLTAEELREYRGTLTEAGKESPHRERGLEEKSSICLPECGQENLRKGLWCCVPRLIWLHPISICGIRPYTAYGK